MNAPLPSAVSGRTIELGAAFSGCWATGAVSGSSMVLTVTLVDVPTSTCNLATGATGRVTATSSLATNGAAGAVQFSLETSADSTPATSLAGYSTVGSATAAAWACGVAARGGAVRLSGRLCACVQCAGHDPQPPSPAAGISADWPCAFLLCCGTLVQAWADADTQQANTAPGRIVVSIAPSASGALAAGATITLVSSANTLYSEDASGLSIYAATGTTTMGPSKVALGGAFEHCAPTNDATSSSSASTLTITLADNAAACRLAGSSYGTIAITDNLRSNQGSNTIVKFALTTSADATSVSAQTGWTTFVHEASAAWTSALASRLTASTSPLSIEYSFSASAKGALVAGSKVTLTSSTQVYSGDGGATVAVGGATSATGFVGCSATGVVSESQKKLTVTLADSTSVCQLASSGAALLAVTSQLASNAVAGTATSFALMTSSDVMAQWNTAGWTAAAYTTALSNSAGYTTVTDSSPVWVYSVPQTPTQGAGSWIAWAFTTAAGTLANTDTVTIVASTDVYTAQGTTNVDLGGQFADCAASGAADATKTTLTVTLSDSGTTCQLTAGQTGRITAITNVKSNAAGGTVVSFKIKTSDDVSFARTTAFDADRRYVTVHPAQSPTWTSATASPLITDRPPTSITFMFGTSSNGALAARSIITITASASGESVYKYSSSSSSVSIGLNSGFTYCSATGATASSNPVVQLKVTLADSAAACFLGDSTSASLTASGSNLAWNPNLVTGGTAVTFSIATSADSATLTGQSGYTTVADTAVTYLFGLPGKATAGATPGSLHFGFTTSSDGQLINDDAVTIVASSSVYTANVATTVVLGGGFSNCEADNSGRGTAVVTAQNTLTITLADGTGTSCELADSSTASIRVMPGNLANNAVAGTVVTFSMRTDADFTYAYAQVGWTTQATATQPIWGWAKTTRAYPTFAPLTATFAFMPSPSGALSAGAVITITGTNAAVDKIYAADGATTIAVGGDFEHCQAAGVVSDSKRTLKVTLAEVTPAAAGGGACVLRAGSMGRLLVQGNLMNQPAPKATPIQFDLSTSSDETVRPLAAVAPPHAIMHATRLPIAAG